MKKVNLDISDPTFDPVRNLYRFHRNYRSRFTVDELQAWIATQMGYVDFDITLNSLPNQQHVKELTVIHIKLWKLADLIELDKTYMLQIGSPQYEIKSEIRKQFKRGYNAFNKKDNPTEQSNSRRRSIPRNSRVRRQKSKVHQSRLRKLHSRHERSKY